MADERHLGNQYLAYVATTEPTSVNDPSDAAYTLVGKSTGFNRQRTKATQEVVDKDGSAVLGGTSTATATINCNAVANGDAGQEILFGLYDSGDEAWFLFSDSVSGHMQESFVATVTGDQWNEPAEQASTTEFTLGVVGDIDRNEIA